MDLEIFEAGQIVFNFNDQGSKFYIILGGEVGIIIPCPLE